MPQALAVMLKALPVILDVLETVLTTLHSTQGQDVWKDIEARIQSLEQKIADHKSAQSGG